MGAFAVSYNGYTHSFFVILCRTCLRLLVQVKIEVIFHEVYCRRRHRDRPKIRRHRRHRLWVWNHRIHLIRRKIQFEIPCTDTDPSISSLVNAKRRCVRFNRALTVSSNTTKMKCSLINQNRGFGVGLGGP